MVNLPLGKSIEAPIKLNAGSVIFPQGAPSRYLYLLKKGDVRLLKVNGPHLSIIKVCKEKEILNEVSVLTKKPTEFAAVAKTDIELVLIDQKDILEILNACPSWVPEMFETLCERLKSTEDIILEHNLLAGEKNAELILTKDEEKKYINALADYKLL